MSDERIAEIRAAVDAGDWFDVGLMREVLAALDGLVEAHARQEEALRAAEGVLYGLPKSASSQRRSQVLGQVRAALRSPSGRGSGGQT